jgi:hypothetical protein
LDTHHVLPLAWGGIEEPKNQVEVCQTGHANIHRLLSEYEDRDQTPPWEVRRQFGPGERALAVKAWNLRREQA